MKAISAVASLVFLGLVAPPLAAQESLAQAAERQKKARTGQTKVITEDELRNNRSKAYSPPSVDGAPDQPAAQPSPGAGGKPAAKELTEEEQRAKSKSDIEKQIKDHADYIAVINKQLADAQLELNDIATMTFGGRRTELMRLLDEGKAKIAEVEGQIAELQEKARRAGIAVSR
jgi:hypothetical protein